MSNSYPQSSINPAALLAFQQQQQQRGGGSVNPAQLMGGAGAGGIKPPSMGNMQMGSINPAQLLSQQSNQNNFMNGLNGMGGGGSINPSALTGGGGSPSIPSHTPSGIPSSPSLSSASHPGMAGMTGMNIGNMGMGGGMGMNASMNASMGLGHQNPNPQNPSGSHPHQQQQQQLSNQQQHFLNALGMTHQQFNALPTQEKQSKMMQYQQQQREQMILRQQQLMQNQNQGGSSNMGGMGNMGGGGMGGMGMQQPQQQHHGMQQPGFGGQQSSMQHGSQGFNPQAMNNMANMGGMNSMFNQNQPSSQQAMNQQAQGDMLGRTGSAMGMHPNSSTGDFFNRPGSSMGMNPMMNNSMMNNLSSGMGTMGGGMGNMPGMGQNMGGLPNNLGNMSMNMNLGGAGGMGGSSMPGMGGMSSHQQQQHPSHGAPGQPGQGPQGSMGPPSGIPRGPGGMGGPGGMSISTGMRNISGTHTPGPPGSARPPSRAMSGTPVNANISARGMSPSTPVSAQPGQQPFQPGQNPYPPSTPVTQGNQGQQQGQRRTPTPAARPGSAGGPRPQSSQSQHHSPVVPPQSPSTRGPSAGPPNVNLSQGLKRKAEDAPIGSPTTATATSISAGPAMGPPTLPRTHSTSSGLDDMMNGMVPQRPGSSIGMNGMAGMQHLPLAPGQPGMGQGIQGGMPRQGMQPGTQGQRQGSVPLRQGSVPLAGGNMPHTPTMGPTGMPGSVVKAGSVPPDMSMNMGTPSAGPVVPPPTATAAAAAVAPTAPTGPSAAPAQPTVNYSLPPLPANVSLNPAVTRVSVVPLATSLTSIPALSENEIDDIKGWMEKDKEYEGVWRGMKDKMNREIRGVLNGGTYEQHLQLDRAIDPKKEGGKEGDEENVSTRTYNGAGVGGGWVGWWEKGGNLFDGSGMKAAVEGGQVQGYGNMNRWRRTREPFDVRYPRHRKEPGRGRRNKREGLKLPRKLDSQEVNKPELLVPIRLEFDVEHHRMRDTFIWNLNESVVTPEHFAQTIVEDYNLGPSYHSIIVKSIQDQLSDYKAHSGMFDPDGTEQQIATSPIVPAPKHENHDKENDSVNGLPNGVVKAEPTSRMELRGVLDDENGQWWRGWRSTVEKLAGPATKKRTKRRRKVAVKDEDMDADIEDGAEDAEGDSEVNKGMKLNEFEIKEELFHEDMRVLIKLDIIVGSMKLDDQFEWDLDNESASPEDFAEVYCQDLGLNGEFKTAIAHLIREQIQTYQKSLFLVGHPSDGSPIQDDDLRSSFLPGLTSAARPSDQVQHFTPLLNYLSDGEIERNEKERDKDMTKRRKRNTRGRRGIALPDREPIRTYRTPAIGFPELDPATLALAAAANAPVSRRAAAAAASLTIASMVASENGEKFTPTLPAATITPSAPAVKKEKTVKGLFKAPPLPPSALGARAQVTGPIASTAADVSSLPAPLENDPLPLVPSISITSAPEGSRFSKLMNARRVKELEREAKEKEFVDGQHPNMINGVWHCSNCGCPENIAIGRRKGPLGDKSQCGTCGKYWHRHRRPRPVEYNPDPDYHSGIKRDAENATKSAAAKKKGAAALRAQNSTSTPAESAPPTPSRTNGDVEMSSRQSPAPGLLDDDERPISPVSTASDASETPLVQRIKSNGHTRASTPPVGTPGSKAAPGTPTPAPRSKADAKDDEKKSTDGILSSPTNSAKPIPGQPPLWLIKAKEGMMTRYPHDRFETILRKVNAGASAEWRIKCLDCPGKLYTPGPGETLSNYEVHLKNRQHRQRVNDRLQATGEDS